MAERTLRGPEREGLITLSTRAGVSPRFGQPHVSIRAFLCLTSSPIDRKLPRRGLANRILHLISRYSSGSLARVLIDGSRLSIQFDRRSLSLSRAELINLQDERVCVQRVSARQLARDEGRLTEKEESRSRASEVTF
jgi:hypothetical protein